MRSMYPLDRADHRPIRRRMGFGCRRDVADDVRDSGRAASAAMVALSPVTRMA